MAVERCANTSEWHFYGGFTMFRYCKTCSHLLRFIFSSEPVMRDRKKSPRKSREIKVTAFNRKRDTSDLSVGTSENGSVVLSDKKILTSIRKFHTFFTT